MDLRGDTTRARVDDGDDKTSDDGSILEEVERNERVFSTEFLPENESDHRETSNDKERDRASCARPSAIVDRKSSDGRLTIAPSGSISVSSRDGDEDHSRTSDEENQSDDVQLVEVTDPSSLCARLLHNNDGRSFFGDLLNLIESGSDG